MVQVITGKRISDLGFISYIQLLITLGQVHQTDVFTTISHNIFNVEWNKCVSLGNKIHIDKIKRPCYKYGISQQNLSFCMFCVLSKSDPESGLSRCGDIRGTTVKEHGKNPQLEQKYTHFILYISCNQEVVMSFVKICFL